MTGVDTEGYPCAPEEARAKFVTQCGMVVRVRIPITTRLWISNKLEEEHQAMPPHHKKMLWRELK